MTHGVRHGFCCAYTLCFDILVRSKIIAINRNAIAINIEYCYNCILCITILSIRCHTICIGIVDKSRILTNVDIIYLFTLLLRRQAVQTLLLIP